MIALWMLYALLTALWLGLAALLGERALRALGLSGRFVWIGALVLSLLIPLGAALFAASGSTSAPTEVVRVASHPNRGAALLDRGLLMAWLAAALALAGSIGLAQRALLRARRSWRAAHVQGASVLVSRDFGPGVIALGRAQIVLPSWVLELETPAQELLVTHEREHLRAGDHRLILLSLALLVLCPFNPVLWWQFSRLKLAIEMDCDARVLAGRRDVRKYAALLLDVGERSRANHLVFAAFAAPPHAIERRIRMMLDKKTGSRRLVAGLAVCGAVFVGVLACQTPEPQSPEEPLRAALGLVPETPPPPAPGKEPIDFKDWTRVVEATGPNGEPYYAFKVKADVATDGTVEVKELPPPPPPPPRPGQIQEKPFQVERDKPGPASSTADLPRTRELEQVLQRKKQAGPPGSDRQVQGPIRERRPRL
jgi:beta-lactamase regulating signal transducer with metallopeptidase domain